MPFYENLAHLESLLDAELSITKMESGENIYEGMILVNGYLVDTNQQFEMLTPDFFRGTALDNPTIKAYHQLFQKSGILPIGTSAIPLLRDTPLRTKTCNDQEGQNIIFARFLNNEILANQWSMLFPDEYNDFRTKIAACFGKKPFSTKKVTIDLEGKPLTSGGYVTELHQVNDLGLWLHTPASLEVKEISAAVDRTLTDTANTILIVDSIKRNLVEKNNLAFNIRGVNKAVTAPFANSTLNGGHQHFMILDRASGTIYAINNTRGATTEDYLVFKQQIELFLGMLGDKTSWKFEFIQGKSRQPDNAYYVLQQCNISQFFHYAAILSGIKFNDIRDTVPPKVSTLMYLLQYAFTNSDKELYNILDNLVAKIESKLKTSPIKNAEPVVSTKPATEPHVSTVSVKDPVQDKPASTVIKAEEFKAPSKTTTEPYVSTDPVRTPETKVTEFKAAKEVSVSIFSLKQRIQNTPGLLKVIERLELGSKSYNPYWMNSQKKLDRIMSSLATCLESNKDIEVVLADPQSELSKAVNMRRLPGFNFFSEPAAVKSREVLNQHMNIKG